MKLLKLAKFRADYFVDGSAPTMATLRKGIRMYRNGGINPKELGGWASEKMAKNYDAGHDEIRWIEAKSM